MNVKVTDLLNAAAVLGVLALAAILYADLPDPMPTHWDARGVVNGYMPKIWGIVALVALPVIVFATMKVLPLISPRGFRMGAFQHVTDILTAALTIGLAGIAAAALLSASGRPVPMATTVMLLVGAIFIVLGNYLGKVRKNFFIGIRTPWTLASDEVWARTHRVGGWSFAVAGVLLIALAWDPRSAPSGFVIVVLAAALVPSVYSFVVYRHLHGAGGLGGARDE